MTATTAPPTPDATRSTRSGAVVLTGLVLGLTAALAAGTWLTTGPGSDAVARTIAIGGGVAAVVVTWLVGRRVGSTLERRTAVAVMVVLAIAIAVASDSGTIQVRRVAAHLPQWTATAERLLTDARPPPTFDCHAPGPDDATLPGFGRVDEVCVDNSTSDQYRWVAFNRRDASGWSGLIYQANGERPNVQSQCIAHLDGPWWQTAQATPNCPTGFVFLGGG